MPTLATRSIRVHAEADDGGAVLSFCSAQSPARRRRRRRFRLGEKDDQQNDDDDEQYSAAYVHTSSLFAIGLDRANTICRCAETSDTARDVGSGLPKRPTEMAASG
jgi:hypothetical protein